jgi:outer membrane protein OmpA-like peptidoglycan-associated protein
LDVSERAVAATPVLRAESGAAAVANNLFGFSGAGRAALGSHVVTCTSRTENRSLGFARSATQASPRRRGAHQRLRRLARAVVAVLLLLCGCGCTPALGGPHPPGEAGADCGLPSDGERIVVLAAGTIHDPRPALTSRAVDELRSAAHSSTARSGKAATGSVAIVVSTDGTVRKVLPLTPRRSTCEVEHGFEREQLIEANIARVIATVSAVSATVPGLDLLRAIDNAVRGLPPGTLIVVSNALSTDGGFDLRRARWNLTDADLIRQLNERGLLANMLTGWHVLFIGVGDTAGDQPPLTKPARDVLTRYMCTIASAAGAASCDVDRTPLDAVAPSTTVDTPLVDVPGISSVVGPDGRTTTTIENSALGFGPDSAELSADALTVLQAVAVRIAARLVEHPEAVVSVRGYVADPPTSTPLGRQQLSDQRAAAVARALATALAAAGLAPRIDVAGAGTPPGMTAMVDGTFDEAIAQSMRKVDITF